MGYKAVEILPFKRTQPWKDIEDRTPLEDFSYCGQPWEHPDISGLGKDTHISYMESVTRSEVTTYKMLEPVAR